MNNLVTLTPTALDNVRRFQGDNGEGALRLGVRGGGCSGFQYALTLDYPQESDVLFEQEEVQIAVANDAVAYLRGATLDYKETFGESGFIFDNPNATGACGCGSSFRVDDQDGCDTTGATLDESAV